MTYSANIQRLRSTSRANTQAQQQMNTNAANNETNWLRNKAEQDIRNLSVFSGILQEEAKRSIERQKQKGRDIHEQNELESPSLLRKKELAAIILRNLEEELQSYEYEDYDSKDFKFDEEIFREIFLDPEGQKFY